MDLLTSKHPIGPKSRVRRPRCSHDGRSKEHSCFEIGCLIETNQGFRYELEEVVLSDESYGGTQRLLVTFALPRGRMIAKT